MNGCAVRQGAFSRTEPVPPPAPPAAAATDGSAGFQEGIASWYGGVFHGRRTANGEVYDMDRLTAAHQTLPFHTLVEVENLDNGQRVLVRINDRGPFVKNRVIDLSRRAATRLDMLDRGTAPVRLRLLDPASGPAAGELPPIAGACLQAGAFGDRANAEARRDEIGALLAEVSFRVISADGLFKVVSENLPSLERARAVQRLLDSLGISSFLRAPIDAREQTP